jgi:hypothetical protein
MDNYIIYQAHGHLDFYNEALYSIISFYKFHPNTDIKIAIYTDNIPFFENYLPKEVIYIPINAEQIKEWKGQINFIHRVKINIIQDFTAKFSGNYLYLDTDTYFTACIDAVFKNIASNALYLEKYEGDLFESKSRTMKPIAAFFKNNSAFKTAKDSNPISVLPPFSMWNAGAIGFNSNYIHLLDKVMVLTDALYPKLELHIIEQFSFCYYFQKSSPPLVTVDCIEHYWAFKEFRPILNEFFLFNKEKDLNSLISKIDNINPVYLSKEKRDYKTKSFFEKTWQKVTKGKKWSIPPYQL